MDAGNEENRKTKSRCGLGRFSRASTFEQNHYASTRSKFTKARSDQTTTEFSLTFLETYPQNPSKSTRSAEHPRIQSIANLFTFIWITTWSGGLSRGVKVVSLFLFLRRAERDHVCALASTHSTDPSLSLSKGYKGKESCLNVTRGISAKILITASINSVSVRDVDEGRVCLKLFRGHIRVLREGL